MPLPGVHDAHPYTSNHAGSPPIQCVSFNTSVLERDHFAASPRSSQLELLSKDGVMYISWSWVPVPKYDRISLRKSFPGSVSSCLRCFAWIMPWSMRELSGYRSEERRVGKECRG